MIHSKYAGENRRRFVRIPFWFITKYRFYPHDVGAAAQESFKQGIGKNISVGGVCFEAKDDFNNGDLLELEIDMPALEHAVCVVGKIAWIHKEDEKGRNAYGLEFTKVKTEDLESVKKIIETFA